MANKKRVRVRPDKECVLVAWIDHAEPVNKQKWDVPTNPAQLYPSVCWSAGFVESENEDVIEIARDHTEYGSSGAPIHILKRCIVYIHRIKVPQVTK
jgi:hypothetical protein